MDAKASAVRRAPLPHTGSAAMAAKLLELSPSASRTDAPCAIAVERRDPRRRNEARSHDLIDIDESFSMRRELGCFRAKAKHDPFA